ncbi:MAG TPA: VWA domain-containing protein [Thermoanaerobaculia bacterium]|nr:VWA domain-containing protein [Thermoanaerobaculia bacterium]
MRKMLLALAFLASPLLAQDKPFQEKANVNLVLLDVTVTDKSGHQILGLTKDDFVVRENGTSRSVDSADYFTNRRLLTSTEENAPFPVERVRQERYFVILFQSVPDPEFQRRFRSDLQQAKRAAAEFIDKKMLPEDRVAVLGYDFRLKVFSDFTADKAQLRSSLDDAVSYSLGLKDVPANAGDVSILRNIDRKKMIDGTGRIYDGLRLLGDALRPIPARKVLILFSPGIGEPSSFSNDIAEPEELRYRPMVEALNSADVTVFPIHYLRDVQFHATENTLSRLASETGGEFFHQVVSFSTPLKRIENASSGYYLLSYYTDRSNAGRFVPVDVKLKNPEFRVQARAGYGGSAQ